MSSLSPGRTSSASRSQTQYIDVPEHAMPLLLPLRGLVPLEGFLRLLQCLGVRPGGAALHDVVERLVVIDHPPMALDDVDIQSHGYAASSKRRRNPASSCC